MMQLLAVLGWVFAQDWLFCLSMPFLWQLNAHNVDIRVLQVLWA